MLWRAPHQLPLQKKTINKLHSQYPLNYVYQKNFHHDKKEIINEIFHQYYVTSLKSIDNTALSAECKQNLDSADYKENINKEIKLLSKKKLINLHDKITY